MGGLWAARGPPAIDASVGPRRWGVPTRPPCCSSTWTTASAMSAGTPVCPLGGIQIEGGAVATGIASATVEAMESELEEHRMAADDADDADEDMDPRDAKMLAAMAHMVASHSKVGSSTGWPSTRSDGTTPQAKRARTVETSRPAMRPGSDAAAQEDNDQMVWVKGFGGERVHEAIAQHYGEAVEPHIDPTVRAQVDLDCRAIASQYFLRFPTSATARAFAGGRVAQAPGSARQAACDAHRRMDPWPWLGKGARLPSRQYGGLQ